MTNASLIPPASPVSASLPVCMTGPRSGESASTARRLHVAIVDEELPYPPTSGKRIRTLNLTLRLAKRHNISYLCHANADASEASQAKEFFADHGIDTVVVDRVVPPRSGMGFYGRLALNLVSRWPYSVTSHDSLALRQAIHAHAAKQAVDLWQCEWTPYAAALRDFPGERRLVMAHNVESLIWQRYVETETHPLKRWYIRRQWRKFQSFEHWAVTSADQTVAVSEPDARIFREEFGARSVAVVDNGVDTTFFKPDGTLREPGCILFLASLDWRPNLDAVDLLLDRIFPAVAAREPQARLLLVGRHPPEGLRNRVAGRTGVELHADVADVRPFLNRCGVLAVPLRIGGGSRIKILEALACGAPVVSTRIGAEGLCLIPDSHLTVVEGIEGFADALVKTIRDPMGAQARAESGRRLVLERYDWDALADRLERIWWANATTCHPNRQTEDTYPNSVAGAPD